jgi:hypothetical protein
VRRRGISAPIRIARAPAVPPGAGDLPLNAFTGELGALNSLSHIIAKRALGIPLWLSDKIASNPN